ncbi:MAG TPA: type II secretion system major pseudopilin GspG [Gemmatimonadales bacterium]|nr:type II secretion system major pseudopilin GspG [Gemmatimonadales bacterium]
MSSRTDRARTGRARRAGFTLIEILVVIAVLGILASLVAPMVFGHVSDAKVSAAQSQIEIFNLALDAYRMDNDDYPSTAQGLAALVEPPTGEPPARRWRGPYLRKGVPLDPWGRAYVYEGPGEPHPTTFEVRSLGRDGKPGGTGEDADLSSGLGPVPAAPAPAAPAQ